MARAATVRTELESRSLNGESPRWREADQKLYWVDTREHALHAFDPRTSNDETWEMPSWIGCHVLGTQSALVALRTGLFEFHFANGSLRQVGLPPYDPRRFIFNDGGCDPVGRFLVGEMYLPLAPGDDTEQKPDRAPLYRFLGGTWVDMATSTKTSNGLAWSPDGRTMYQSDTAAQTIYAFDYDPHYGQASKRRVFAEIETRSRDHGPDGAAVDTEGFYWIAIYGEGCLLRFDPDGTLERRIDMPVQYPTMPAFGGRDLTTLYITSANWMIDADKRASRPLEGNLFSVETPVPGLPTPLFDRTR